MHALSFEFRFSAIKDSVQIVYLHFFHENLSRSAALRVLRVVLFGAHVNKPGKISEILGSHEQHEWNRYTFTGLHKDSKKN